MVSYIEEFFRDPKGMFIFFLLAFPGRILALSLHEFAHAWVAHRCGDDTAKMMGRMTVNPAKHLDPLGTILMLLVGFGWAKPVPVNPRNYRDYRKDDLKVSLAGVTMNLILFCVGNLLMFAFLAFAIRRAGDAMTGQYLSLLFERYDYFNVAIYQVEETFGEIAGYLFQMFYYFTVTNLVLCLFNLLPVPPLDGYHVLNDLVLRRRQLFANPRTAQIASTALFVLVLTGVVGRALGWVDSQILTGAGNLAIAVLRSLGLIA
ncbi:MAG: site-2 protease family protein [Clostridia bacterium]|nr:site-2 protease family protein [Clostridia bacterium]